jgi:hypothetical protein
LKDAKERKPYYILLTEHLYCDVSKVCIDQWEIWFTLSSFFGLIL